MKIENKLLDNIFLAKQIKQPWETLKEIKEETSLEINNIGYVSSLVFMRPNGFSTIVVSLHAEYESGEVTLNQDELNDYAWVDLEQAKKYNLIENIYEQIEKVEKIYRH